MIQRVFYLFHFDFFAVKEGLRLCFAFAMTINLWEMTKLLIDCFATAKLGCGTDYLYPFHLPFSALLPLLL